MLKQAKEWLKDLLTGLKPSVQTSQTPTIPAIVVAVESASKDAKEPGTVLVSLPESESLTEPSAIVNVEPAEPEPLPTGAEEEAMDSIKPTASVVAPRPANSAFFIRRGASQPLTSSLLQRLWRIWPVWLGGKETDIEYKSRR